MSEQNNLIKAINERKIDLANSLLEQGEKFPENYPSHQLDQLCHNIINAKAFHFLDELAKSGIIQTDLYEYESFDRSIFKIICRYFPADEAALTYLETFLKKFDNLNEEVSGHSLLSYALEAGADPGIIKSLINAGCNTAFKNGAQENLIFQVVNNYMEEKKALAYLDILIDAGLDVNEPNIVQKTALHQAIERGRKHFIPVLLKNGALPNEQDKEGRTAFFYALVHQQDAATYRMLAESEAPDFTVADRQGESILLGYVRMMQSGEQAIQLLAKLLDDGADLHQTADWYAQPKSALEWILEKKAEVLKMVIEKGSISINEQDDEGNTLLHKVCRIDSNYDQQTAKETYKKVKLLLEAGADPSIINDKEETAIMIASKDNLKAKTVELLLQKQ